MKELFRPTSKVHQRKASGKHQVNAAECRKRQRRHNVSIFVFIHNISYRLFILQKAHARARVLNQSTTIDDSTKKKVLPVLRAEFMSSEESLLEDTNSESAHSDNSEDHEQPHSNDRKRLMRHKLPWRSQEMQKIIESLDRKLERRRTPRGKAMCLKVVDGKESARSPPENLPEWARELFS